MPFQEHHFRNLARARDHLTETILSLRSASDRMIGDDWIEAYWGAIVRELLKRPARGPSGKRIQGAPPGIADRHGS